LLENVISTMAGESNLITNITPRIYFKLNNYIKNASYNNHAYNSAQYYNEGGITFLHCFWDARCIYIALVDTYILLQFLACCDWCRSCCVIWRSGGEARQQHLLCHVVKIPLTICAIGHVDYVGLSVYVVYISATRWPIYCCPPEKESNSKWP
jgi:hypothetical protein